MIHPSTMAGPTGLNTGFGTTNPFQQNLSTFIRNTPFQTSGFGPGTTPFQSPPFGFGNQGAQVQNTINEIVRQTIPTVLANYGISPTGTFQSQFGFPTTFGFPQTIGSTPFGQQQFQPGDMFQNQGFFTELIRQSTNQALQNLTQQNPYLYSQGNQGTPFFGTPNTFGTSQQQQQYLNQVAQCCQQVAQCTAQNLLQCGLGQNPTFVAQCCQAVVATLSQCLLQANPTQIQSASFNAPFNLNNTPQFGVTPGIPTGVGAF
jgi:hypothetical protein